jgi:hypothetical protein
MGGSPLPEIEHMSMEHIIIGIFNFGFINRARLFIATALSFKINLPKSFLFS